VIDEVNRGQVQLIEVEGVNIPRDLGLISLKSLPLSRTGEVFFKLATRTTRPGPTVTP
jgi:hypothetical protein